MKAMILAAGFGTRLRPYTSVRPKPLFPILGRPLLLITIAKLRAAGFAPIIVNCHYLSKQIIALLKDEEDVLLQEESEVLGTGGGLRLAMELCGSEPLLVTNGDIYHNIAYDEIYRQHQDGGFQVSMVLHDCPRFNTVAVGSDGFVHGFPKTSYGSSEAPVKQRLRDLAFTGIHVVDSSVIKAIPKGCFFDIIERYADHLMNGAKIKALELQNIIWHDIGTPDDYLRLHADLFLGKIENTDLQEITAAGTRFLGGRNLRQGRNLSLIDWAVIGHQVTIGNNVSLERVVVWDGAVIADNTTARDCIIY